MLTIILQSGYRTGRPVSERDWNLTLYFIIFIAIILVIAKVYDWLNDVGKNNNAEFTNTDEVYKLLNLCKEIEYEFSKCEQVITEYNKFYKDNYDSHGPESHALAMTYDLKYRKLHQDYEEKTKRYKLLVDYICKKADKRALKVLLIDFKIYNSEKLEKAIGKEKFRVLLNELASY
jgi:hypothetical protein